MNFHKIFLEEFFQVREKTILTFLSGYVIIQTSCGMSLQSIHANIIDHSCYELRPYGQPGQLPTGNWILPLLIELKAQFYKLVTLQPIRYGVHQLVKRSIRVVKVSICYIGSEKLIIFDSNPRLWDCPR